MLDDDDGFDDLFQRNTKPTDEPHHQPQKQPHHQPQQSQQRARSTPHTQRNRFDLDTPLEESFLFHDAPLWAGGNSAVDLVKKYKETSEQKASEKAEGSGAAAMAASTAAVGRGKVRVEICLCLAVFPVQGGAASSIRFITVPSNIGPLTREKRLTRQLFQCGCARSRALKQDRGVHVLTRTVVRKGLA